MPTVLRLAGQTLNVDEAIRLSPIEPSSVSRRGDQYQPTQEDSAQFIRNSIVFDLSDCGFDQAEREIAESIDFLANHFQELQRLLQLPGIEHAGIAIGLRWKDTFTQTDFLPAELIRLAGQLNLYVAISHYPISNSSVDDNEAT